MPTMTDQPLEGNPSGPRSTQDRILRAAIDEFADKGFAGARVNEIARRSKSNKRMIYYYFDSKAGLYDAVQRRMISRFQPRLQQMQSLSLTQVFKGGLWRQEGEEGFKLLRLLAWEGVEHGPDDPSEWPVEDERRDMVRTMLRAVEHARDSGQLDHDLDPSILVLMVVMSVAGPVALPQVTRMVTGRDPRDIDLQQAIGETMTRLVEHSMTRPLGGAPE